jgi:hypothetical protein
VVFTPTSAGTKGTARVNVTVVSGINLGLIGSPVSGTGVAATSRSVTPAGALNFGGIARGSQSNAQAVTVTNTGINAIAVTSIGFTGGSAANWKQTNNCGSSIAVNTSCTVNVVFAPLAGGTTGARNSTLSIVDVLGTTTRAVNGSAQ